MENSSSTLGSQTMIFYLQFMSFIDPVLHHLDYPIQYYMNSKILNPQFHAYHMEVILCSVEKLIFRVDASMVYTSLSSLLSFDCLCLKCTNAGKYLLSWLCQMLPSHGTKITSNSAKCCHQEPEMLKFPTS